MRVGERPSGASPDSSGHQAIGIASVLQHGGRRLSLPLCSRVSVSYRPCRCGCCGFSRQSIHQLVQRFAGVGLHFVPRQGHPHGPDPLRVRPGKGRPGFPRAFHPACQSLVIEMDRGRSNAARPAPFQCLQDRLNLSGHVSMPARLGRHVMPTRAVEFPFSVENDVSPAEVQASIAVRKT